MVMKKISNRFTYDSFLTDCASVGSLYHWTTLHNESALKEKQQEFSPHIWQFTRLTAIKYILM